MTENKQVVVLFYLKDPNWKKSDVVVAIGYNESSQAGLLVEYLMIKLNKQMKRGYSIINMTIMSYNEFKKAFPKRHGFG